MRDIQAMRVQPGSIDAEMAGRTVRRIKDYLMRHPDQAAIPVLGEQGGEKALILSLEAVSLCRTATAASAAPECPAPWA